MLFYFYLYIALTVLPVFFSSSINRSFFRPDIFIPISLLFYALPVPFNYIFLNGDAIVGLSYEMCTTILFYNLLFLAFFQVGYYISNIFTSPVPKFTKFDKTRLNIKAPDLLIYGSLFFSLILILAMFYKFGGIGRYFSISRFDLYKEKRDDNLGIFTVGFDFIKLLIVLLYTKVLFIRKFYIAEYGKNKMILIIILILIFSGVVMGAGDRRPIVGLLISLMFVRSFFGKIKEKYLFLIGTPFLLVMQLFTYLRHLITTPEKMLVHLQNNYTSDWLDISKGEAGNPYLVFHTLMTNTEKWDYFFGSTYIYNFSLLFPGFIMPFRYEGIANWFARIFFPETFAKGGGYGFNIAAEGYINFGLVGIIISALFIGILANYLWKYLCINNTNPLKITTYALLLTLFFIFGRTDSGGLMKEFFTGTFLPIASIYVFFHFLKINRDVPDRNISR